MMKKALAGLALLVGACTPAMHRVSLGQDDGTILYRQTSSSSKSYELEACLEVKNPLLYSVADGIIIVDNFAKSMLLPGYVMEPRDSTFNSTQHGLLLCRDYLYLKNDDHWYVRK